MDASTSGTDPLTDWLWKRCLRPCVRHLGWNHVGSVPLFDCATAGLLTGVAEVPAFAEGATGQAVTTRRAFRIGRSSPMVTTVTGLKACLCTLRPRGLGCHEHRPARVLDDCRGGRWFPAFFCGAWHALGWYALGVPVPYVRPVFSDRCGLAPVWRDGISGARRDSPDKYVVRAIQGRQQLTPLPCPDRWDLVHCHSARSACERALACSQKQVT